jgi:hypothetical protein
MYFALVCGLPEQTLLVAFIALPGQAIRPGRGHTTCTTRKKDGNPRAKEEQNPLQR